MRVGKRPESANGNCPTQLLFNERVWLIGEKYIFFKLIRELALRRNTLISQL